MNENMDDLIDTMLRERFEGPVRADGFCERVMDKLPTRRRRSAWPLVAGVIAAQPVHAQRKSAQDQRKEQADKFLHEQTPPSLHRTVKLHKSMRPFHGNIVAHGPKRSHSIHCCIF